MTTYAHAITSSYIAYTAAVPVQGPELHWGFLLTAIGVSVLLDFDHVYFLMKDRYFGVEHKYKKENLTQGVLHDARSPMHELFGVLMVSFIALVLSFAYPILAKIILISFLVHVILDMIMGKSKPFNPINMITLSLFQFTFKQKVFIDILVVIIFIYLWIIYLQDTVYLQHIGL